MDQGRMTPRLKISRTGLELLKGFEGYRRRAVRLADGQWSVGYGHTKSAKEGSDVAPEDAEALLLYDLQDIEAAINDWVLAPLTQHQYDALVSFALNIGLENFRRSAVLRRLNEGRVLQAACAMELWRKARVDGEDMVVDALVRRRAAEKSLFLTPPGGAVAAPSSEIRPEPDFSVQAAVPRETPRELHLDLDDDSAVDIVTEVVPEPADSTPVVHTVERMPQPYPMEATERLAPVASVASPNVVAFPDHHAGGGHAAVALAVRPVTTSAEPVAAVMDMPVALSDAPQTSPEEILDIVRRIREMTESAPLAAANAAPSLRSPFVEEPVVVAPPPPVAAPVAPVAAPIAPAVAVQAPVAAVSAAPAAAPVVEVPPVAAAAPLTAAPMAVNPAAGPSTILETPLAPNPSAAPATDPAVNPLLKSMTETVVTGPIDLEDAINTPAPPPPVRDFDPSTIVIPEDGLVEPLYSGEEVFDIGIVHEAPPSTGKDSHAIFLGDSKSMYVVSMGVIGFVAIVMGFLGMGGEHATFMSGAFPLIAGLLMLAGSAYLVYGKYQKFVAHHA